MNVGLHLMSMQRASIDLPAWRSAWEGRAIVLPLTADLSPEMVLYAEGLFCGALAFELLLQLQLAEMWTRQTVASIQLSSLHMIFWFSAKPCH